MKIYRSATQRHFLWMIIFSMLTTTLCGCPKDDKPASDLGPADLGPNDTQEISEEDIFQETLQTTDTIPDISDTDERSDISDSIPDSIDPYIRPRSCLHTINYTPQEPVEDVRIAGEWDWENPIIMSEEAGVYSTELDLPPGLYCYKFIIDDQWILDPQNPYQVYCNDVVNSGLRSSDRNQPLLALAEDPVSDGTSFSAKILFYSGCTGSAPSFIQGTLLHNETSTPVDTAWDPSDSSLTLSLNNLEPGKYTVRVEASDREGISAEPVLLVFWIEESPFLWKDALIYMIMTDRFVNGNTNNDPAPAPRAVASADWFGGDLAGVTQVIESGYFNELGVKALWLTPFNQGAEGAYEGDGGHYVSGYHGYWPISPRNLDPRLGTPEELHAMVYAAHNHGIRILMDLVVNHVHEQHIYYQEHPEWFNNGCVCGSENCDWTEFRLTCLFAPYMPDVDWTNRETSEQFISDALWWLETYDLDGDGIDAVKHVDDLSIFNISTRIHEIFEQGGTSYYLVGETAMGWGGDELTGSEEDYATISRYIGPWALDGQFDFVLFHAVVEKVFAKSERGFIHLDVWTGMSQENYPEDAVMSPYIGSHDTSRFCSIADYRDQDEDHSSHIVHNKWSEQELPVAPRDNEPYERQRIALCWLLTQRGAPMIYMGDEYGDFGGHDPDNRHMFRLDLEPPEVALLNEIRQIGLIRQEFSALRRGIYYTLGATETFLPFLRIGPDDTTLVVINGSPDEITHTVDLSGTPIEGDFLEERLGFGAHATVQGAHVEVLVPPRSCAVFSAD